MMNFVLKNDEFCIKHGRFKTAAVNVLLALQVILNSVSKTMNYLIKQKNYISQMILSSALKTINRVSKMMKFCIKNDELCI